MASGFQRLTGDARRFQPSYSRSENRPPMSTILCRNGPQCRKFQEGTCNYNHDFSAVASNGAAAAAKKSLNIDSPAFTPAFTPKTPNAQPVKVGISPKAVNAATFTPRGTTPTANAHASEPLREYAPHPAYQPAQQFAEFVPGQSFMPQQQTDPHTPLIQPSLNDYNDSYLGQTGIGTLDGANAQMNMYAQQSSGVASQQYFQDPSSYRHPLNYHLYASVGPHRENLMAYQRSATDFFIPDDLREGLQRKAEATLQVFANSTLPLTVEHFHSLVALDTNTQKAQSTFGYPTWLYKATSSRDGQTYCLRRIEGFRLTSEQAIKTLQDWKRIASGSVVQIHDAFTGKWFNDSSLVVVTDYHPLAQTLADRHFGSNRQAASGRPASQVVSEGDLWMYIVQIASALKAIHENALAARTVVASKVLVTSKNRLRLNGCGILDILQYDSRQPVEDLQRADLEDLGRLILGIATRNQAAHHNATKALELVSRSYTERLRACISWLLSPPASAAHPDRPDSPPMPDFSINTLLHNIADKVVAAFDSTLHYEDALTSNLMRELENGRLVRLLTKLNVILERPEPISGPTGSAGGGGPSAANPSASGPSSTSATNPSGVGLNAAPSNAWSETGERYPLKLFRDYVFHQVDPDGRPVLDLGHMLACLNKLDAGVDERLMLVSRDEVSALVVSFRDLKRAFEAAWADISKAAAKR